MCKRLRLAYAGKAPREVSKDVSAHWIVRRTALLRPVWSFSILVRLLKKKLGTYHAEVCLVASAVSGFLGEFESTPLSPHSRQTLKVDPKMLRPVSRLG